MKAIIHSIKRYPQFDNASTASGARINRIVADAVNVASTVSQIQQGSVLKAVYLELWVRSQASTGNDTKFQLVVEKLPAGQTAITFTQMNNLETYPNKKNVLFFSQGVLGDLNTQAIPVVRQWFKVPKSKQRFGLGDRFVMSISATNFAIDTCGFATYKEYT